jgi:hypothetical protein
MKFNYKTRKMRRKARVVKRKITAPLLRFKPIHMLVKNRRAVNAVMSNLILVAAVIVVGFAVLAWEQNQSAQYQQTQSAIINKDVNQLLRKAFI